MSRGNNSEGASITELPDGAYDEPSQLFVSPKDYLAENNWQTAPASANIGVIEQRIAQLTRAEADALLEAIFEPFHTAM